MESSENTCSKLRDLTEAEQLKLIRQDSVLVSSFKADKLEKDAKRNWDLFYKRNSKNFFKDRHWTTREFKELLGNPCENTSRKLLEIGCGVGNFIFPLIEEGANFFVYGCDLSPRAIEFVKMNSKYDSQKILAFEADATSDDIMKQISSSSIDVVTLIFMLSSVHPDKHAKVLECALNVLKPGGVLLFRDYGLHDMAQIRFQPGQKISENFYVRQDGTRAFYFSKEYFHVLAETVGLDVLLCDYVHRRTTNRKEGIDVPRVFLQSKLAKR